MRKIETLIFINDSLIFIRHSLKENFTDFKLKIQCNPNDVIVMSSGLFCLRNGDKKMSNRKSELQTGGVEKDVDIYQAVRI